MITNKALCFFPLLAFSLANPLLPCNCGLGPGQDVCRNSEASCAPLVVRPVDVSRPELPKSTVVCKQIGLQTLGPVSGPCDCHASLVKPAIVPKPPCLACGDAADATFNHQLSLSQNQRFLFGGAPGLQRSARPVLVDDVIKSPANPANNIPADPVSLQVAYKLAQESCNQNEDKLSFGFRSIPKDVPLYVKRVGNSIPEENLLNLNGQIVELKKKKCGPVKNLDDEAAEQLIQMAEEEEDAKISDEGNVKTVSLAEIGYGPAKIKQPRFVDVKRGVVVRNDDDGLATPVESCNDGFVPGNVLIKQVPKEVLFSLPEPYTPPPPAIPPNFPNSYNYLASSSSSSSSSASSSNSYKKSIFLQNIGYD